MTEPLLEVDSLSFSVGGKRILAGVSFQVRRGEYLSVIGPNGAGKTTLLKCLNRVIAGWSGEVRLCGRPLRAYSQRRLAALAGYVPQADARALPFTVRDFVMMGRYPHLSPFSSPTARDEEAVRGALAATGTEPFAERLMGTLSGGERQKVFIAAALAQAADLLLLDEPTTFLDPSHQAEIGAILARLNRDAGATIVSVTHDVNAAAMASDRILALKAGRVAYCGPAGGVMREDVLRDVYGRTFLFVAHPVSGVRLMVPEDARRAPPRGGAGADRGP